MTQQDIVKCAQLDMLIEVDRICEKYNLSYFLVGGTLLGAIRHNGFIPWDDDIDIGMMRCDYEEFIKVCKIELSNEYAIFDWDIDKKAAAPFIKMKIKGTHYREELSKNTGMNDAIFIDIFPLDNAPDSKIKQMLQGTKSFILKKIILLKGGFSIADGASTSKKIVYFILKIISKLKSYEKWKRDFITNAIKYNNRDTQSVVNLCGTYSYKREIKKKGIFCKLEKHVFENIYAYIPSEYDKYLTEVYGNYMELPPESMRVSRHGISYIDLGDYKVKSNLSCSNNV